MCEGNTAASVPGEPLVRRAGLSLQSLFVELLSNLEPGFLMSWKFPLNATSPQVAFAVFWQVDRMLIGILVEVGTVDSSSRINRRAVYCQRLTCPFPIR